MRIEPFPVRAMTAVLGLAEDYTAVAFDLSNGANGLDTVSKTARQAGLKVYGWIQVGRDETAARAAAH